MITKLLSLAIEGFRGFEREVVVNLDADVVLVHGSNGTGKTSLLGAVEFALTGSVEELSRFEADYPRCLKNINFQGSANATVRYLDHQGVEKQSMSRSDGTHTGDLSANDIRNFRERCYLSQTRLGRLLEMYQASTKDDPEQPLVRFIRELLGLDLLDNLTAGLYEVGHLSRIEKSLPVLAQLRERSNDLTTKIKLANEELTNWESSFSQAVAVLQKHAATAGDPAPSSPWDVSGIVERSKAFSSSVSLNQVRVALAALREDEGRLLRAIGFSDGPGLESVKLVNTEEAISKRRRLEGEATPMVDRINYLLRRAGKEASKYENFADQVQDTVTRFYSEVEIQRKDISDLAVQKRILGEMTERATTLENEVATFSADDESVAMKAQRIAEGLARMVDDVSGTECPVCGRDFTEVSTIGLREHITAKISALSADAAKLRSDAERRLRSSRELAAIKTRVTVVASDVKAESERQARIFISETEEKEISSIKEKLDRIRADWIENEILVAKHQRELTMREALAYKHAQLVSEVKEVASRISSSTPDDQAFSTTYIQSLIEELRRKLTLEEQKVASLNDLGSALAEASRVGQKYTAAQQEVTRIEKERKKVEAALDRVNTSIAEGRSLAKAASDAKTRLLQQVFNERLNKLWRDLFSRLVKDERFQPLLTEPRTVRGITRTTIGAWREGVSPFEQFAAVASSGNLNTAALSLFLALNLVERARHGFIVLDDPVQAMDDLHIVQLANLLREIRQKSGRQLIIAVHEKSLFDYLCLELGPTAPNSSLLSIELSNSGKNKPVVAISRRQDWRADKVKFDNPKAASA